MVEIDSSVQIANIWKSEKWEIYYGARDAPSFIPYQSLLF